ncbi:hypothetical protein [Modestobacter sp. I12A-02662]|uniref:hypothetical protein n=1 Tax=Modestobacter sp. I12A-02662 TaxID=1730496 RepID=UPI0034DF6F96
MSGIQSWIAGKLDDKYNVYLQGEQGLRIERPGAPTAHVYCIEPDEAALFDVEDLEAALTEMPQADFFVIVRRAVAHQAYERAEQLGVCLDTFGELQSALFSDYDIRSHRSKNNAYLQNRLRRSKYVESITRRGGAAYEITRVDSLRPLIIVTIDHYELTADGVYTVLDDYDHLVVDIIVTTNPYAMGFSRESWRVAERAGIEVDTLNNFLDRIGEIS